MSQNIDELAQHVKVFHPSDSREKMREYQKELSSWLECIMETKGYDISDIKNAMAHNNLFTQMNKDLLLNEPEHGLFAPVDGQWFDDRLDTIEKIDWLYIHITDEIMETLNDEDAKKKYLEKYKDLERIMEDALNMAIKNQEQNPYLYIAEYMMSYNENNFKVNNETDTEQEWAIVD